MTDDTRTYDRWSDNDFDDLMRSDRIPRHTGAPLSADDCCALATLAVAACIISNAQAPGVARTLLRSYRASPNVRFDPEDGPTTFAFRAVTYDRKTLRAVAVRISAATYGHEDPAILSQQLLQAVLDGIPTTSLRRCPVSSPKRRASPMTPASYVSIHSCLIWSSVRTRSRTFSFVRFGTL